MSNNNLPLYDALPPLLKTKVTQRIAMFGKDYKPRTEHLKEDGTALFVNDLIFEESPYLLQHAHNPVNWQAWLPESFELAQKQNKPIFLSIGYATCHWCHVMEHESFENVEIAQFINEHFIAIKVDRERRSAVDAYYMTGVQIMSGHGGWPMSNFLTPDAKPFFGGTYYQPTQFLTLLKRVNEVWHKQEHDLRQQATKMDGAIKKYLQQNQAVAQLDDELDEKIKNYLLHAFDELQGGFTSAPKFPQEPWLLYLLQQNDAKLNNALKFTLNAMQQGGIFDQVGGGFHRYATDNAWLVPHFEKMLYNQSQLGEVYAQAAWQFNSPIYARTAGMIFDYVLAEMTNQDGAFYSAGDADSQGEEGVFFTWSLAELHSLLSVQDFTLLQEFYAISKNGNFEGRNILTLNADLQSLAQNKKIPLKKLSEKLANLNKKLFIHRKNRPKPLIDRKIITAWNAQMIYSLVHASAVLQQEKYLQAAIKAMQYLLKTHKNKQGQLMRNSLNGKASNISAELEDYAWLITALIKLYDVTEDDKWLEQAQAELNRAKKDYWDVKNAGFFDNIAEKDIPNSTRIKQSEDSAEVSANGQMLMALARLQRRTAKAENEELLTQGLLHFSGKIVKNPLSHSSMLRARSIVQKGENTPYIYVSKGMVKITSQLKDDKIELKFHIKSPWHINANKQMAQDLRPLTISNKNLLQVEYPQAKQSTLSFSKYPLSTFAGDFMIQARVAKDTTFPLKLSIELQTCSDKTCLPPEKFELAVYSNPAFVIGD